MTKRSLQHVSNKQPQVSIGLPVYNGERFIREALDSMLDQEFSDFELIISDNASTDKTEEICREYAVKDARIKYIRQARNIGGQNNFSFVVEESVGQYFSWLAHDDALCVNFLSICVDFLDKNPMTCLVSGDFSAIDEGGHDLGVKELLEIRSTIPWQTRAAEFYRFPISNSFFCVYGLMRRDALVNVLSCIRAGPMLSASELPLLSRFAALGEIASLPLVLRTYRYHVESMFHIEQAQLSSQPIKGRFLKYYNVLWHQVDQMLVLMQSSYPYKFKLHILYNVLKYYIIIFTNRILRFAKYPMQRLRTYKSSIK